jgi:hypothetical protein
MEDERRVRSRMPLRIIMTLALGVSAVWLLELYMKPTWSKIVSFVLGYLVGTLVNEWVHQRSSRIEPVERPAVGPVAGPAAGPGTPY